jgi:hypothetical protein
MLQFLETHVFQFRGVLHNLKVLVMQNLDIALAAAAMICLILFLSWVGGLRKRALSRRESVHGELIAYQLDRMASALERIARLQRAEMEFRPTQAGSKAETDQEIVQQPGVGSIFGFGGRVSLANPLYRPK